MTISLEQFQKYSHRFDDNIETIKTGPKKDRKITDVYCLVFFLALFISFVVITIVFLSKGGGSLKNLGTSVVKSDANDLGSIFAKTVPQVIGMIFLSIGLSIIFIVLCSKIPKIMAYFCIFGTLLVYVALIVIGLVTKVYALTVIFAIVLAINLLILWCYWEWIQVGIVVLKVSGDFLTQKPGVYFISIISLVMNILFEVIWIVGYLSGASQTFASINPDEDSRKTFNNLLYFYYAIGIFFGFFFYYCLVFTVATAAANWYYKNDKNVLIGFFTLRKHLGSITFGAIVITIITIVRRMANQAKQKSNGVVALVMCMIECLLSCIQDLMMFLNHNAIIVMAMTGEDYIDSAKTAISIIFENMGLFMIVDFFTDFLGIYSMIICVIVPALLGGGLIYAIQNDGAAAVFGGFLIFVLAWIMSSVILGMLNEIISCVFIFYCLDKRSQQMGLKISNCPVEIRDVFDSAAQGRNYKFDQNRINQKKQIQQQQMYQQRNNSNRRNQNVENTMEHFG